MKTPVKYLGDRAVFHEEQVELGPEPAVAGHRCEDKAASQHGGSFRKSDYEGRDEGRNDLIELSGLELTRGNGFFRRDMVLAKCSHWPVTVE